MNMIKLCYNDNVLTSQGRRYKMPQNKLLSEFIIILIRRQPKMNSDFAICKGKRIKARPIHSIFTDLKELRTKYTDAVNENNHLRMKLEIDPLTKVYRRTAAIEHIDKLLLTATKGCALIVLDLDNFKSINDLFGHVHGDSIIALIAECIINEIPADCIPGRFGGDEFFVFMPDTDEETALNTANNIIDQFKAINGYDGEPDSLSCSGGVSVGMPGITYSKLFSMADKALYSAKKNGKSHAELYNHNKMKSINSPMITYFDENEFNANPYSDILSTAISDASKSKTTDDAVHTLFECLCKNFDLINIKIMSVNLLQDMVTVVYNYKELTETEPRRKNNVGYYLHVDLETFRSMADDRTIFRLTQEQLDMFSNKFRREIQNMDGSHFYYYINEIDENNYNICVFERRGPLRFMEPEDARTISELTSIILVYADKVRHVSRNEQMLSEQLNIDKVTGVHTLNHFYILSGLIRKLAMENNLNCYLLNTKFNNIREFNKEYSFDEGDAVLRDFAQRFEQSECKSLGIIAHNSSTFYTLIRTAEDSKTVKDAAMASAKKFIEDYKKIYPDFTFSISIGIKTVIPDVLLFRAMDDAYFDKTEVK